MCGSRKFCQRWSNSDIFSFLVDEGRVSLRAGNHWPASETPLKGGGEQWGRVLTPCPPPPPPPLNPCMGVTMYLDRIYRVNHLQVNMSKNGLLAKNALCG